MEGFSVPLAVDRENENEIRGIKDIKDGYRQMTQVCFAKFSDKMSYRAMIWDEFLSHFCFCDEEDSGLSDEE